MNQYGEPWHAAQPEDATNVLKIEHHYVATMTDGRVLVQGVCAARIAACVNACEGLSDADLSLINRPITRFIRIAIKDGERGPIRLPYLTFRRFVQECESTLRTLVPALNKSITDSVMYEGVEVVPV